MIGYFIKSCDISLSQLLYPFLKDITSIINENMLSTYGRGIRVFLIEYYLEGKYLQTPNKAYKVNSYLKKDQSISVTFFVQENIKTLSANEIRKYIVNTTEEAIHLVKRKMDDNDVITIDFKKMSEDFKLCSDIFLST